MTPLRANACKCSSAALADLKPSSAAISARVGGAPVLAMAVWIRVEYSLLPCGEFGIAEHVDSFAD